MLQLDRIAPDMQRAGRGLEIQRHIARDGLHRKEFECVAHHLVEVDVPGLERRSLQESAQAADDFAGALVVALDVGKDFPDLVEIGWSAFSISSAASALVRMDPSG